MQVERQIDSRLKGPFAEQCISNPVQAVGVARRAVDIADRLLLIDDARAQITQELLLMFNESENERVRLDALKSGVRELRLLRADWLKDAERTKKGREAGRPGGDEDLRGPEITSGNAAEAAETLRQGIAEAREKILSQLNDRKSAGEEDHTSLPKPPHSQAHRAGNTVKTDTPAPSGQRSRGSRRLN